MIPPNNRIKDNLYSCEWAKEKVEIYLIPKDNSRIFDSSGANFRDVRDTF